MGNDFKHITALNFLIFLLFHQSQYAAGTHTYLCIRLPSASFPDGTYTPSGDAPKSVGMEKFPQNIWKKYYYALRTYGGDAGFKDSVMHYGFRSLGGGQKLFELDLFPVRGRNSLNPEFLAGWYRVRISINAHRGRFDEIVRSFIIMVTDEQQNPIGEFVTSEDMAGVKGATCPRNDATKYMIIPCGGVSKYEPTNSNVIVWASSLSNKYDNLKGEHGPIVPEYKERVLDFYYRFSMQDGNRNSRKYIVFRLLADLNEDYDWKGREHVETEGQEKGLFSAVSWFNLKTGHVPGATDPLLTNVAARDCNINLRRNGKGETNKQQWFIERFSNDVHADLTDNQNNALEHWLYYLYKYTGCSSAKFYGGRCKHTWCETAVMTTPIVKRPIASGSTIPQWHSPKTAKCPICMGRGHPWSCTPDVADSPTKYNNKETKFLECMDGYNLTMNRSGCTTNRTKEEVRKIDITVFRKAGGKEPITGPEVNVNDSLKIINTRGVRGVGFGTLLYAIRKGHGIMMVVVAMFFVPVICFSSRYFKETFMDSRILLTRIWFQLHIQCVFWIIALYLGGMLLAFAGRALLGVSLTDAGKYHRLLGWSTIGMFIIMAITGPFRLRDDPGRSCTIGTHWVLGYLFYFLNIVSVISSVYIPGSPISDHDKSIFHEKNDEFTVYKALVILTGWLAIELVLGVIMTIHIHTHDQDMLVEGPRKYFPPFIGAAIPVLREKTRVDAAGFTCRRLVFYVYLGLAMLAALGMSGAMIANKMTSYKGYGPMWCTHDVKTLSLLSGIRPECRM